MLVETSSEKRQALIDLLSLPDTPDIRRGHHRTIEGRPDRFRLARDLAATFVQWHKLQVEERAAEWESSAFVLGTPAGFRPEP
jgi:hypothetical protein